MSRDTAMLLTILAFVAWSFITSSFGLRMPRRKVRRQREIPNGNDIHHLAARARGKRSWQWRPSA